MRNPLFEIGGSSQRLVLVGVRVAGDRDGRHGAANRPTQPQAGANRRVTARHETSARNRGRRKKCRPLPATIRRWADGPDSPASPHRHQPTCPVDYSFILVACVCFVATPPYMRDPTRLRKATGECSYAQLPRFCREQLAAKGNPNDSKPRR